MPNTVVIGSKGEEIACSYLREQGYRILEKNWKKSFGEIDIIALDGDFLVFIEVKSREEDLFEKPEEAMTVWKIRKVARAGEGYKNLHPELPDALRVDFIGITFKNGAVKNINLIKNVSQ